MLDWKKCFLVSLCLSSSLFVYVDVSHFCGSSLQAEQTQGWNLSDPDHTFCQLLIRSAMLSFQGVFCPLPRIITCATCTAMLTASAWFWLSVYLTFPFTQMYGFALGWTKENWDLFESTPKEKCLLLFRLCRKCYFTLYFSLLFWLVLRRLKWFSKQFQPWHLRVQCLPQPAIHICSSHKLDPIRWHQTMAYSSISPAQRQGSPTIRKCFFLPLRGVRSF